MKAIILAAGVGSRLGSSDPKPLTLLSSGESILERQIKYISDYIGINNIIIVVGHKKSIIMEKHPELLYVYNINYDSTNTSKSLLLGLEKTKNEDTLWINGDVVFEKKILKQLIDSPQTCVAVNNNKTAEEEVKYKIDANGYIDEISKDVENSLGEAVGINKVTSKDIDTIIDKLKKCNDQDYFEKALELSANDGMKILPVNVGDNICIEIDFKEDLLNANNLLKKLL